MEKIEGQVEVVGPSPEAAALAMASAGVGDLTLARDPEAILARAVQAAKALQSVVSQSKRKPLIVNGQRFLFYEEWATTAKFYGVVPEIERTARVQFGDVHGWEASAVGVVVATGARVGRGEAMCLTDEPRWYQRPVYEWSTDDRGRRQRVQVGIEPVPEFQRRSMAETRACAKVLRALFSWVVVLAGYAPTPAEEMTGNEGEGEDVKPEPAAAGPVKSAAAPSRPAAAPAPAPAREPGADPEERNPAPRPEAAEPQAEPTISEPQARRLWAIAKGAKFTDEAMHAILLEEFGIESTRDVPRRLYDEVVARFGGTNTPRGGRS